MLTGPCTILYTILVPYHMPLWGGGVPWKRGVEEVFRLVSRAGGGCSNVLNHFKYQLRFLN
jgi:hypothetical protein